MFRLDLLGLNKPSKSSSPEQTNSPFPHSLLLPVAFHLGSEPYETFLIHVGMSPAAVIMGVFCGQSYCWDSMGTAFLSCPETLSNSRHPEPFLWQSFCPFSHDFCWGREVGLQMRQLGWTPSGHLFSEFWSVTVIVSICCRKKLLWWGRRGTLTYGYRGNYLE